MASWAGKIGLAPDLLLWSRPEKNWISTKFVVLEQCRWWRRKKGLKKKTEATLVSLLSYKHNQLSFPDLEANKSFFIINRAKSFSNIKIFNWLILCSVKMAGYWHCPLTLVFVWTSTSSWSIRMQKNNSANIQLSWPHPWSITHIYFTGRNARTRLNRVHENQLYK